MKDAAQERVKGFLICMVGKPLQSFAEHAGEVHHDMPADVFVDTDILLI